MMRTQRVGTAQSWRLFWLALAMSPALGCGQPKPSKQPKKSAQVTLSPWHLESGGVGALRVGAPLPQEAFEREGRDMSALWNEPARGLDEAGLLKRGLKDQEGRRVVSFDRLGVNVALDADGRVDVIWASPRVKSSAGVGAGATLQALEAAHGIERKTDVPEPYLCSVSVRGLAGVYWLFREPCAHLKPQTRSVRVFVGG